MLFYFQSTVKKRLLLQDLGTYLILVRRSVHPTYQRFIYRIGHILLVEIKLGRVKKKMGISGSTGPKKSLRTGKFSLAQASVN